MKRSGMADDDMARESKTQGEKFTDLARDMECDEDEEAFDERLRRIAKASKAGTAHGPKKEE
jgi:hypothetical protein